MNIKALCMAYRLQNADISIPLTVNKESFLREKQNMIDYESVVINNELISIENIIEYMSIEYR